MLSRFCAIAALFLAIAGCSEPVSRDQTQAAGRGGILVMGDSMLAAHALSGRSVPDVLERRLGRPVTDRAVVGARMIYRLPISGAAGMSIPKQFRAGNWDWVVINGGGNDLWLGCGCSGCERRLDRLAGRAGTPEGEIPALIARLRRTGARVVWVGYLRSPGRGSPIESCRDEGEELERRIAAFADRDAGVVFVSLADLVPHGDASFHAFDMIHPSVKGSAAIADRILAVLAGASPR